MSRALAIRVSRTSYHKVDNASESQCRSGENHARLVSGVNLDLTLGPGTSNSEALRRIVRQTIARYEQVEPIHRTTSH
jgi:hypothetical protein